MFSLIVSTYRSDKQVKANLSYLATFAEADWRIVFSDCSGDPAKQEYLLRLSSENPFVSTIVHAERVPLYTDVASIIRENTADSEFVGICGDDDYVSLRYLQHSLSVLKEQQDAVCSLGNYIICLSNKNTAIDTRSVLEGTSVDRLRNGFTPTVYNTFFFAVFRREAMLPWASFCIDHPLIASFFDFIHCISLMAQGKVVAHDQGHYLWTAENWDTPEKKLRSLEHHFSDAGVSRSFSAFNDLHFAMEGANFLLGRHSPLKTSEEKSACAQIVWDRCMDRFRTDLIKHQDLFQRLIGQRPAAVEALLGLFRIQACDDSRRIDYFAEILACFSEPLAERYRVFDFGLPG